MSTVGGSDGRNNVMTDTIEFYSPTNAYGAFSNFSTHAVRLDGLVYVGALLSGDKI